MTISIFKRPSEFLYYNACPLSLSSDVFISVAEPPFVYLGFVSLDDSEASLTVQFVKNACNAGEPRSIPGSGRSPGEGIGYPFQYSWASFVAQPVKNPSAMQKTWVQSLSWEDPLGKRKATDSKGLENPGSQRVGHD